MEFIVSYFSKCAVSCVLSFCFPLGSERVSARALSLSLLCFHIRPIKSCRILSMTLQFDWIFSITLSFSKLFILLIMVPVCLTFVYRSSVLFVPTLFDMNRNFFFTLSLSFTLTHRDKELFPTIAYYCPFFGCLFLSR